ncbi:MAG: hypothetical protein Q4A57_00895 [Porphyromonas circumdentaria]|nr:hypothetical protein [Porphyromonas circumdentaria]
MLLAVYSEDSENCYGDADMNRSNNDVVTLLDKAYRSLPVGTGKPFRVVKAEYFYQNQS